MDAAATATLDSRGRVPARVTSPDCMPSGRPGVLDRTGALRQAGVIRASLSVVHGRHQSRYRVEIER